MTAQTHLTMRSCRNGPSLPPISAVPFMGEKKDFSRGTGGGSSLLNELCGTGRAYVALPLPS